MTSSAEVESAIAPFVDTLFYYRQNPDVADAGSDAVRHYANTGWHEGRDPNPWFSTKGYLRLHRDVAAAKINPLYHYVTEGRAEGRPTRLAKSPTEWQRVTPAQLQPRIDPSFYGAQLGHAFASVEEAVSHYIAHGDLGLIDPHPHFAAEFYFSNFMNSQFITQSPLRHYLEVGRLKGYLPNPLVRTEMKMIASAEPAAEKTKKWIVNRRPDVLSASGLAEKLAARFRPQASATFVSVSHDDFLENVGGIQICLALECESANERNDNYIHVAPFQSMLTLQPEASLERVVWRVSINGEAIGVARASDLLDQLKSMRAAGGRWVYALHHVIGHSLEALGAFSEQLSFDKSYFWLHDYFFACEQFNLLRNDYEYCGAPPPTSTACELCAHGSSRSRHLQALQSFFDIVNPHILAPSKSIADNWTEFSTLPYTRLDVVPHCTANLEAKTVDIGAGANADGPVRVAFVGYPAFHKGWHAFDLLYWALRDDPRYMFCHLGQYQSSIDSIYYVPVSATVDNRTAMIDALRDHMIDAVLIWPEWPETFSIVTAEAIAAGATVLTHPASGNCVALAKKYDRALVFEKITEMIAAFASGDVHATIKQHLHAGVDLGTLDFSHGLTLAFDDAQRRGPVAVAPPTETAPAPPKATRRTARSAMESKA